MSEKGWTTTCMTNKGMRKAREKQQKPVKYKGVIYESGQALARHLKMYNHLSIYKHIANGHYKGEPIEMVKK